MADVIIQRESVALVGQVGAKLNHFLSWRDTFQDFDHDLIGRKKASRAALEREKIEVDERFGVAGERLQTEKRSGVHNQAVTRRLIGTKNVLAGGAEQQFVREEFQFVVEDRLAGDEFFVHATPLSRKRRRN